MAERSLIEHGPEGVRVQRIAAELGLTDAAVHYHFGNREGLVKALLRYSGRRLVNELSAVLSAMDPDRFDMRSLGRVLTEAYTNRGAARVALWLTMAGWRPSGSGMPSAVVANLHDERRRRARRCGRTPPRLSDTKYVVALLNAIYFIQPIAGEAGLASVDAASDAAGRCQFLDWVGRLVSEHLHGCRARHADMSQDCHTRAGPVD